MGIILAWTWFRRRTRLTARLAAGGLSAFVAVVILQAVVVTDRERIRDACLALARAVDAGDIRALAGHIDDAFRADGLDKPTFIDRVRRALTAVDVQEVKLTRIEVDTDGNRATATFNASCRLVGNDDMFHDRVLSSWRVTFARSPDAWRAVDIEPVPTPTFPLSRLDDVLR